MMDTELYDDLYRLWRNAADDQHGFSVAGPTKDAILGHLAKHPQCGGYMDGPNGSLHVLDYLGRIMVEHDFACQTMFMVLRQELVAQSDKAFTEHISDPAFKMTNFVQGWATQVFKYTQDCTHVLALLDKLDRNINVARLIGEVAQVNPAVCIATLHEAGYTPQLLLESRLRLFAPEQEDRGQISLFATLHGSSGIFSGYASVMEAMLPFIKGPGDIHAHYAGADYRLDEVLQLNKQQYDKERTTVSDDLVDFLPKLAALESAKEARDALQDIKKSLQLR